MSPTSSKAENIQSTMGLDVFHYAVMLWNTEKDKLL